MVTTYWLLGEGEWGVGFWVGGWAGFLLGFGLGFGGEGLEIW